MIALEEAIQKIKVLWEKEKTNPMPKEVALQHLGYKAYAGYAARVIAALKKFNLTSEEKGYIKLTKQAIDLNIYEPTNENYIQIIKEIALKPIIYERLYNEYSGRLPSDETLRVKLIKEYGFNDGKVADFINGLRRTISFAGLSGEIEKKVKHREKIEEDTMNDTYAEGVKSFTFPLLENNWIKISFGKSSFQKGDSLLLDQVLKIIKTSLITEQASEE